MSIWGYAAILFLDVLCGMYANKRGRRGWVWFAVAVLFSPVVSWLILLCLRDGPAVAPDAPGKRSRVGGMIIPLAIVAAAILVVAIVSMRPDTETSIAAETKDDARTTIAETPAIDRSRADTPVVVSEEKMAGAVMPTYDVKATCAQVASAGGTPSQLVLSGCYQNEQTSYDALKRVWGSLPKDMRDTCDQVARAGGFASYAVLSGCIQNEQASASSNSRFEFRR